MANRTTVPLDHLAERYGHRAGRLRGNVVFAVATSALLAVTGWFIYQSASNPSVQAGLYSWEEPADGILTTTIEIARSPGTAVTCDLVAVDRRRIVVGQLHLRIPAGPEERLRVTDDIPLEGDGIAPELRDCQTGQ